MEKYSRRPEGLDEEAKSTTEGLEGEVQSTTEGLDGEVQSTTRRIRWRSTVDNQ
jgi:hypothetical protein